VQVTIAKHALRLRNKRHMLREYTIAEQNHVVSCIEVAHGLSIAVDKAVAIGQGLNLKVS
jgi:hypothetical protein